MMKKLKIPDFTLPAALAGFGARLPQTPPALVLTTALNLALDRVLPSEPLQPLSGKRFAIVVSDAGLTLRFTFGSGGFSPLFDAAAADLTIRARSRDFIALLLREEDPDSLFFNRRLLMQGDTDLGLLVKNTLDSIETPQFDAAMFSPAFVLAQLRLRLTSPQGV